MVTFTVKDQIISDGELYKFNLFLGKTCETYKNWNKVRQSAWATSGDAEGGQFSRLKRCGEHLPQARKAMDRAFTYTPCIRLMRTLAQQLLYVGVTR